MIDSQKFGVSFSLKQCRNLKLDPMETLNFLIQEIGLQRFRLMSYWNEHEKKPGKHNFEQLDKQIKLIEKNGGIITLCLGARQPRWPESHWPKWALELPEDARFEALYKYIEVVVKRYRNVSSIISWQLENEAFNRSFGQNGDFNRKRLINELNLVKKLDKRIVIMSTSNTWGIPVRKPMPDMFGFTLYTNQFEKGKYKTNKIPIIWWKVRAFIIKLLTNRNSFIHELQAEPWGPKAIWNMTKAEQQYSMNIERLQQNIKAAKNTKLYPIDLWGGEWWYLCFKNNMPEIAQTVKRALTSDD